MNLKGKFLSSSVPGGLNLDKLFGDDPGPLTEAEQFERRAAQAGQPFSRIQHRYEEGGKEVIIDAVLTPKTVFVYDIAFGGRMLGDVVDDLLLEDLPTSVAGQMHAFAPKVLLPGLQKA